MNGRTVRLTLMRPDEDRQRCVGAVVPGGVADPPLRFGREATALLTGRRGGHAATLEGLAEHARAAASARAARAGDAA